MPNEEERTRLAELRAGIDEVDNRIIDVLVERFKLTREIGILKRDAGFGPVDPKREHELYERVRSRAVANTIDPETVEAMYRALMTHVVVEHEAIARGETPHF